MSLSTVVCSLHIQALQDENIHFRLKKTIASLDMKLGHAQLAARHAKEYLGKNCHEKVLTGIRTLVATIPYVRTVNLAKNNEIYCTSVFGKTTFSFSNVDYPDSSLVLMRGNQITPSQPLIVYTRQVLDADSVLIGIDAYHLYKILTVLDGDFHLYLKIGELYLDHSGRISTSVNFTCPRALSSARFGYTVLAECTGFPGVSTIIHYEKNLFFAMLMVSLLLTWFFKKYLAYRNTLGYMLRKAIKYKQLKPYIQPIVKGEGGQVIGGEVLMRWEHPELGFIPPDSFIPVAEQTGLIKEITAFCFSEVSRQLHAHDHVFPEGLYICFNVSAINFQDEEIIMLCTSILSRLNIRVVLEVTEREIIKHTHQTDVVTGKLRQLGVLFSLDDFGTGHANYSYLQQFQPEFIKIDKFFTSNVETNATSILLVKNMINLAQKFNCQIVAEGVEDSIQLQILRELGIEIFQGYYFYRPMQIVDYMRIFRPIL